MPVSTDKVKNLEIFSKVPIEDLRKMCEKFSVIQVKEGQQVFTESEPAENIYIVLYGALKLTKSTKHDSSETITHFMGRGEIAVALINTLKGNYPLNAYALEDSEILCIPKEYLIQTMLKIPALHYNILNHISERFIHFHTDKAMFGKTVAERLAEFLIRTSEKYYQQYGGKIPFPITRTEIASRLGTTKETVIRLMSDWNKKGWIKTNNQHIHVVDKNSIRDAVK